MKDISLPSSLRRSGKYTNEVGILMLLFYFRVMSELSRQRMSHAVVRQESVGFVKCGVVLDHGLEGKIQRREREALRTWRADFK